MKILVRNISYTAGTKACIADVQVELSKKEFESIYKHKKLLDKQRENIEQRARKAVIIELMGL